MAGPHWHGTTAEGPIPKLVMGYQSADKEI